MLDQHEALLRAGLRRGPAQHTERGGGETQLGAELGPPRAHEHGYHGVVDGERGGGVRALLGHLQLGGGAV